MAEESYRKNYHPLYEGWSSNLFTQLTQHRFKRGGYFVMEESNEYRGSAGWKPYTDDIALVLTRAYVPPPYRAKFLMGEHILPLIFERTTNFKRLWITVNLYNKTLYDWFSRPNLNWPSIYKEFIPIGITEVHGAKQYVMECER